MEQTKIFLNGDYTVKRLSEILEATGFTIVSIALYSELIEALKKADSYLFNHPTDKAIDLHNEIEAILIKTRKS